MTSADFAGLLKTSTGLDVNAVGSSSIERAVRERLVACGLPDQHAYWQRVQACGAERQALIDAVVVPETWFFRDREAFSTLARIGREHWLRAPAGAMRLLSLPCSTGEEPYSMAMALLDVGVPKDYFRIDAVDVSPRALAQAERAVYGKNSFRGDDVAFRDRHFDATAHGYRPRDAVRRQVRFQHGNVLAEGVLPGQDTYDVVFCRNLLIYFDSATQGRAVSVLERLLAPNGTLFVAPSEMGVLFRHPFVPARIPLTFAFHKLLASVRDPKPADPRPVKRFVIATPGPARRPIREASVPRSRPLPPAGEAGALKSDPSLDDAIQFADRGHFAEAAALCEAHLGRHGPSARAFYLLGLVRDATGNAADALNCYRKALYLEPDDYETLIQFALLVEHQGDASGARLLNDRARRLEQRGRP